MAEEPAVAETGTEAVVAPPVVEEESQAPLTIEDLAQRAGWSPKDQFKGDPEKWKPADEYLLAGKERISSLGKELKGVREQVSRMTQASEAILQQQLADKEAAWQARWKEAFEAGDEPGARHAQQQIDNLKQSAPANRPPPDVADFAQRNASWFQRDPIATNFAIQVCELNKNLPPEKQLEIAEAETRKRFPEHFPQQQTTTTKPPPQVGTGASRSAVRTSGKRGFADMPKEAQDAALAFEKNHGVSKDEYAANYFKKIER